MKISLYMSTMQTIVDDLSNDVIHLVYDFAEKVFLPHPFRQPVRLHFVTGLKADLFAVHISNKQHCFVYCLPEGHRPGGKTASEVASVVYHNVREHHLGSRYWDVRRLIIHSNNYAGQNKNRFMV